MIYAVLQHKVGEALQGDFKVIYTSRDARKRMQEIVKQMKHTVRLLRPV